MEALDHQREALDEIVSRARAFHAAEWQELPIQPRWASLLTGPTGVGKTAIATLAAEAVGASLCRVSSPNWKPVGSNSRGTRETISVIAEHVARHDRTILFVDEIDKLADQTGDSSWKSYIRAELFDLLDVRWPMGLTLTDLDDDKPDITIGALTTKLRDTVFILAAGTFQSWFDDSTSRRTMGFNGETNPETHELSADIVAEKMPRELANRFNSQLIRLPELTPDDYHRIARETENQLPLRMREAFRAQVQRRIPGAIAAKKGVRFLEEVMLATLITLPPSREIVGEIVKINPVIPKIDLCTLL